MSSRVRWLILACAVVGLGFAGAAAWVHYRLLTDPTYVSPCDVNATFSCSEAYLSRYGSVAGIPVALGGVLWFGVVALLAAFARTSDEGHAPSVAAGYIFGASWDAVGGILGSFSLFIVALLVALVLGYQTLRLSQRMRKAGRARQAQETGRIAEVKVVHKPGRVTRAKQGKEPRYENPLDVSAIVTGLSAPDAPSSSPGDLPL